MTVLLLAGSPSARSRSAALLDAVQQRLHQRGAHVQRLQIRDLSPQALILADFGNRTISQALGRVAAADVLVVATPVYKAAYSGVLKVFLDLLSQTALAGKTVLPLDYALRPVLQSLGAKHILPGIYATDAQVTLDAEGAHVIDADIGARLDQAVHTLITETLRPVPAPAGRFAPVPFSQVRCSV
jgi:FMN reductase